MAVSKRLRFEILKRDNHACRYCGGRAPDVTLTIDHVVPVALGGRDQPDNLVAACKDCNAGKSSVPADASLVANVAQDAIRWGRAIEQAAASMAMATEERLKRKKTFADSWDGFTFTTWKGEEYTAPRDGDWDRSLDMFRDLGLSTIDIADAVAAAMYAPRVRVDEKWRYFCGICWGKIREIQQAAKDILLAEDRDS